MTTGVLLRDAELDGRTVTDVRVRGGSVVEIGGRLTAHRGEYVLDARGGALLAGLCDHHVHLHAMAAADRSVPCGPPAVTTPEGLAEALAHAPADERGWVRGIGYAEDVAGLLDSVALDRLHAARPVRVQHRGGALWMVNSAGAQALDLARADHAGVERDGRGRPTGRLWRADDWLRTRTSGARPPDLRPVGARLAGLGITHLTDATPDLSATAIDAIGEAMRTGALPQRVRLLGAPLHWTAPGGPRSPTAGPYKIVLADSGLPGFDALVERIRAARRAGRAVAVHCVTREALFLLTAALDAVGGRAGDRIEHASLVPAESIPRLRDLGPAVVTQPGFIADRGDDYLRDVPAPDHQDLYRVRSLVEGGVPVALASDAPYGPVDPWRVIDAAVRRRTRSGQVVGPGEGLTALQALDAFLGPPDDPGGPPRRVTRGAPADLVLLRVPRAAALERPSADLVAATLIAGAVVWSRPH
ncbi:amidohydrolase family protein [Streptomyces asoensis]|uniref:Amidohydrolase family protein n=1 Tax=Streptomyces asoensis TaxID=249586 RepID=A0A6M4WZQ9_9ACTN|nr:amidohydrolase family protein [Streptomyces asoensis]QJT06010.1 amidohydrolase family protein [Streptomyces asoensis]